MLFRGGNPFTGSHWPNHVRHSALPDGLIASLPLRWTVNRVLGCAAYWAAGDVEGFSSWVGGVGGMGDIVRPRPCCLSFARWASTWRSLCWADI